VGDLDARRLVANIETVRTQIAHVRDRVEELDRQSNEALLSNGKALEAAAGGLTCIIATLAAAQEEIRRG
jgi:hypothetical protein